MYVVGGVMDSAVLDVGGCADFFIVQRWTVALYFQGTEGGLRCRPVPVFCSNADILELQIFLFYFAMCL